MNIILVRPVRAMCGISYWSTQLVEALKKEGVTIVALTPREFLMNAMRSKPDAVIANIEIGEDTKNGDVFAILLGLLRLRLPKSAIAFLIHSVFRSEELQLPRALSKLAISYQDALYRLLTKMGSVVSLSPGGASELNRKGVRNVMLGLGAYSGRNVFDIEALPRAADDRIHIGLVGHPYRSKHYDDAVIAFGALPQEVRQRACIVIIGGDPDADPEGDRALTNALALLAPDEYFRTGPLGEEEFSRWHQRIDLALLPYSGRSSSSAVYSRLVGYAIPALVSNAPLFEPLIAAGGAIPVENWPTDAVGVLSNVLQDPAILHRMREGAKKAAETTESIGAVAKELLRIVGTASNAVCHDSSAWK